MLLRLRLANHRSIRQEVDLSLISPGFRGAHPGEGSSWGAVTNRVAGIYGANASGKSTILDGFEFLVHAVLNSASSWSDRTSFPHAPFAFDQEARRSASLYEIDFTVTGVRHTYGFRSTKAGVEEEWLFAYPASRRRVLFERGADGFRFGRTLPGENVRMAKGIRPTQLFLSLASNNNHPVLGRVRHEIVAHFRFARFNEADQQARLRYVMRLLSDQGTLREAEALVHVADFGISALRIREVELPDGFRETFAKVLKVFDSEDRAGASVPEGCEKYLNDYRQQFQFVHLGGADDDGSPLTIGEESSGTVAWLALAVPALHAIRSGAVFLVDEIDSSLHPRLTASLIQLFKDEGLNRHGAQLIFTTHDTSLLGRLHGEVLGPDEVWLTEKNESGVTELYSLSEFPVRDRDNLERRYIQGRYGAVPVISWQTLRGELLERDAS